MWKVDIATKDWFRIPVWYGPPSVVATDPCISLLVCLPHIAIPSLMLPLKQFQSSADSWWLISSSVISVHMLSPAVPSDVCVVLALLSGPGDVCHHPTAVPQGEWGPVETNVSHGHRRHHASTCGPTGEKWMSCMITDAIMLALVDQQVRNECLAWSQMPLCWHLWTNRWKTCYP